MAEDENAPEDEPVVEKSEEMPESEAREEEAPESEAREEEATEARAAGAGPTQDELRAALDRVGVSDVLVEALMATVSLGFRRVSAEARDLPQARLAIESLRALEPVLRDCGVDDGLLRPRAGALTSSSRMRARSRRAKVEAEIGVFGGSGFYELLDRVDELAVETPFGPPSATPVVGEIGGKRVEFIPRHGRDHGLPPAQINYRANLWAMKELGVRRTSGRARRERSGQTSPSASLSSATSSSTGRAGAGTRSTKAR